MALYSKTTNFAAKDSLVSGDPNKIIKGADIGAEFDSIQTAFAGVIAADGSQAATANIPMGSFRLTGLGAGTAAGHSIRWEQHFDASGNVLVGPAAVASGKNIAAKNNATTPNTKIDITADEIILEDSSGNTHRSSSVSGTIDFGTTGANGLDTGVQAVSTWYYGWVIYNPSTNTTAVLGSLSSSAPTMPSGYTYKALVTAARSNGSTQFVRYRQFGNGVFYEAAQNALSNGTATIETAVALTSVIPPIALAAKLFVKNLVSKAAGVAANTTSLRIVSGTNYESWSAECNANTNHNDCQIDIPNVSQNVYYLNTTGATPDTASTSIDVLGFKMPMGGE